MKRFILCVSLLILGLNFNFANEEYKRVRNMEIEDIPLETVQAGTYQGEFAYDSFTYVVEVTVAENKIADIKIIKNRDTKHAKKAVKVIKKVLKSQTPNVDARSGATTTSKAFLKAIETALKKGIQAQPAQ